MSIDQKLDEMFNEDFFEILNIVCEELSNKDSDYVQARKKCIEILDKNKNLRLVCDQKKAVALSKSDVELLVEYLDCDEEENLAYQKSLLYTGFRIAYMMFKNANMLKK